MVEFKHGVKDSIDVIKLNIAMGSLERDSISKKLGETEELTKCLTSSHNTEVLWGSTRGRPFPITK